MALSFRYVLLNFDSQQLTSSPDLLLWSAFAGPLERAEDALARLDERVRHHPLAEGWAERAHLANACAALWLEGELVHLEDLVLRDAGMDVRIAAEGTNRAMGVLRARRLVARRGGAWALSYSGLDALRGRHTGSDHPVTSPESAAMSCMTATGTRRSGWPNGRMW